ncbi:hypothetical protein GCM10009623_04070 [Nocardioides aestuarii]|uniref:Uncharacterized protein n=1 Tax=Nocardioides aestuarii TaxID=252231 RepID=A0ABW4TG72_9ACTN
MNDARRALLALAAGGAVAVLGYGAWRLASARYLEDYCLTRAPLPLGDLEMSVVRGPSFDAPWRLRCDWQAVPDVVVTDPVPALGLVAVGVVALVVALAVLRSRRVAA